MNSDTVTADIVLHLGGRRLEASVEVPAGPTTLRRMLPLVQALTNAVVDVAEQQVEACGEKVSCRKGCGACCRQLVPITESEARHIRDLVEALPEPRRSQVRARFAEARRRIDDAGLLTPLLDREQCPSDTDAVALRYFALGIPCPFLEDESCSIHPDRPVSCREYLVTSPPEECARPGDKKVKGVELPARVFRAFLAMSPVAPEARFRRWVPLSLALLWAEAHPDEDEPRPGPELLRELFARLTGQEVPPPSGPRGDS